MHGTSGRYGLNYAELVSPTVKSVQEIDSQQQGLNAQAQAQKRIIEEQEKKIKELEQALEAEKKRNDGQDARLKAIEQGCQTGDVNISSICLGE